jgi:hypothetical protein
LTRFERDGPPGSGHDYTILPGRKKSKRFNPSYTKLF